MANEQLAREVLADVLGYRADSAQRASFLDGNMIPVVFPSDAVSAMLTFADRLASADGGGEALARRFHEAYERLAPSFGYETRKETRQFDPASPNGKLMIAVCEALRPTPEREANAGEARELFAQYISDAIEQQFGVAVRKSWIDDILTQARYVASSPIPAEGGEA